MKAPTLLRLGVAIVLVGFGRPEAFLSEFDAAGDLEPRAGSPHQSCHGQSCTIADLSGSSGKPYMAKEPPVNNSPRGFCCILTYNPQPKKLLYEQKPRLRKKCKEVNFKHPGNSTDEDFDDVEEPMTCYPKTLIFAKGTDETGPLGNSVGPALQSGLEDAEPNTWAFHGVIYKNAESGNHCVGLPGGRHAAQLLEKVAANCPNTQIIMSGYSQGAMVSRNGIAYSKPSSHKNIKAIVTFGDPFNGAPLNPYQGPIIVFCNKGDRVCDGRNIIKPPHLEYVGKDTDEAVQRMIKHTS